MKERRKAMVVVHRPLVKSTYPGVWDTQDDIPSFFTLSRRCTFTSEYRDKNANLTWRALFVYSEVSLLTDTAQRIKRLG